MRTRQTKRTLKWSVLAQSVRGAAHCRSGQPNQDAGETHPAEGFGLPLMLAVSDGHGSPKSFRSDRGSRFAVSVAIDETKRFIAGLPSGEIDIKRAAADQLPGALVQGWEQRVRLDLADQPFTEEEERRVTAQCGAAAWRSLLENPLVAYGATLLAAVATASFLLLVQIGDGDIVTVSPSGCADRPLKSDARLFAGETTSLCLDDAVESFVVGAFRLDRNRPALVLLSTDGYVNSYREDSGFLKVGSDLLTMIREEGIESVQRDLPAWLDEVSVLGSGDDVTLGVMCLL